MNVINTGILETDLISLFASPSSVEWIKPLERDYHISLLDIPPLISVSESVVVSAWQEAPLVVNL